MLLSQEDIEGSNFSFYPPAGEEIFKEAGLPHD